LALPVLLSIGVIGMIKLIYCSIGCGRTEHVPVSLENWVCSDCQNPTPDPYREILDMLTSGEHGGRTEAYEATVKFLESKAGPVQNKSRIQIPTEILDIIRSGLSCMEATDNSMSGRPTTEARLAEAWLDENTEYA
jgi:hypothetical protein